jgi:hypothetical protein
VDRHVLRNLALASDVVFKFSMAVGCAAGRVTDRALARVLVFLHARCISRRRVYVSVLTMVVRLARVLRILAHDEFVLRSVKMSFG